MLTSAGCNALDYLLDNPSVIHCVDANSVQSALLELKKVLFLNCSYSKLWQFFGEGRHPNAAHVYRRHLAPNLSAPSERFWNQHINYFIRTSNEPSFYFRGTSGKVALMMNNRIKYKGQYNNVLKLLNAQSLAEQAYYFDEIERVLWNGFNRWLISQNATMAFLGVPSRQRSMIEESCEGGLMEFIRSSLGRVFKNLPISDNYFWRVYLMGSYTRECCPNYLKHQYFNTVQTRIDRINLHTCYLNQFLQDHPGCYSHYVLLDHQDWLAEKHPDLLAKEWRLILKNSRPGTRILFRSAGISSAFLPDFVFKRVDFDAEAPRVAELHKKDRVGTYGSTHLGVITS
jgi:S-adenosylmethionine-diacylglycerol 3-amino-3-carboxypropyl transferase